MAKRNQNDTDELGPFVLGALLGGMIGAIAAFWFAPKSGEETRQDIQERGAELRDDVERAAADARHRIEGESIEEALEAGKAEARRFREGLR